MSPLLVREQRLPGDPGYNVPDAHLVLKGQS